jgi:hypothetical protein
MDNWDNWLAAVAIVVSVCALGWSARADRNQRRRDLLLDSYARMIANSKKLTHEDRKGFRRLDDSVERGPLRDDRMRQQSDEFRNEVGIQRVLLKAFGDKGVQAATEDLYENHRQVRHAIWHAECDSEHDCEESRRDAWSDVAGRGVGTPSQNIYPRFKVLIDALTDEVRRQTKITR